MGREEHINIMTPDDVLRQPESFTLWAPGDPVSRENWASLHTNAFALSRGSLYAQRVVLQWAGLQSGTDILGILRHHTQDNPEARFPFWLYLADEEQEYVWKAFKRVGEHRQEELITSSARETAYKVKFGLAFSRELCRVPYYDPHQNTRLYHYIRDRSLTDEDLATYNVSEIKGIVRGITNA